MWTVRDDVIHSACDPDDRAVLEKYLDSSTTRDDLLRSLKIHVRSGAPAGIARAFLYFDEDGLRALCEFTRDETLNAGQALPTLARFPPTESTLQIMLDVLPHDENERLSELLLRKAAELFPAPVAKSLLNLKLRNKDARIRAYAVSVVVRLFDQPNTSSSDAAREFFVVQVLPTVGTEKREMIQMELLEGCGRFADGRFLDLIKSRLLDGLEAPSVRIWAVAKYLDLLHIQGLPTFMELSLASVIMDFWRTCFDAASVDVQREVLAVALRRGLHELPVVKNWIADAEHQEKPELLHELEDARCESLCGLDPWKFARPNAV